MITRERRSSIVASHAGVRRSPDYDTGAAAANAIRLNAAPVAAVVTDTVGLAVCATYSGQS